MSRLSRSTQIPAAEARANTFSVSRVKKFNFCSKMLCINPNCGAVVDACVNFCHVCSQPIQRSAPPLVSVPSTSHDRRGPNGEDTEQNILESFRRHQATMSSERTSNESRKRRKLSLTVAPSSHRLVGAIVTKSRTEFTRRRGSTFHFEVTSTDELTDIHRKCINSSSSPEDFEGCELDKLLTNGHRSVTSYPNITGSSSLKDLRDALGGISFSKIKFYIQTADAIAQRSQNNRRSSGAARRSNGGSCPTQVIVDLSEESSLDGDFDPPTTRSSTSSYRSLTDIERTSSLESPVSSNADAVVRDNEVTHQIVTSTLQEKLNLWQRNRVIQETYRILINREAFKSSVTANLRRKNFPFTFIPNVVFVAEAAIDGGGPRREFFTLLMQNLAAESGIFDSIGDSLTFAYNIGLLEEGKYLEAGKLVAWSILHGGPGLHGLAIETIELLNEEKPDLIAWIKYVLDERIKSVLMQINDATEQTWTETILETCPVFEDCGFPLMSSWKFERKREHLNSLLTYVFYYRNVKAFNDFKLGLDTVGSFWSLISVDRQMQLNLLGFSTIELTAESFENLIDFGLSVKGSNNYTKEKQTNFAFSLFLQKLEDNDAAKGELGLSDLLSTLSGCRRLPPLGLPSKIQVIWFDRREGETRYPKISTCNLSIELPRGFEDAELFALYMETAIMACRDYFGHI